MAVCITWKFESVRVAALRVSLKVALTLLLVNTLVALLIEMFATLVAPLAFAVAVTVGGSRVDDCTSSKRPTVVGSESGSQAVFSGVGDRRSAVWVGWQIAGRIG